MCKLNMPFLIYWVVLVITLIMLGVAIKRMIDTDKGKKDD